MGQTTPQVLANHINQVIFPAAGVQTTDQISLRTACHWLIKLGWTYTKVKKGVYVDGHEREDVKEYRNKEFLPAMAEFKKLMVQYNGPDLDIQNQF